MVEITVDSVCVEFSVYDVERRSVRAELLRMTTGGKISRKGGRVTITALEGVGNYALQPTFSDGHNTGIYSWDQLYELATHQDELWAEYFAKLKAAGVERDAPMAAPPAAHGHGHCPVELDHW